MISLLILDIMLSNLTIYNLHLFILGIPKLKSFAILFLFFILLSFFEYHYLFNLLIIFLLYLLNRYLNKRVRLSPVTYFIEVLLYYAIYLLSVYGIMSIVY